MADTVHKKPKMIKELYIMIILLVSMIGIVYAWMYNGNNGVVESLEYSTVIANDSLISVDKSEYDYTQHLSTRVDDAKTLSGLGYADGDGLKLYYPVNDPWNGNPIIDENGWRLDSEEIEPNKNYLELKISAKNNLGGKIYIMPGTDVLPFDLDNPSTFGNFSKNYIAAATRMAVIEVIDDKEYLRLLYAPNRNIEIIEPEAGVNSAKGWSIDLESSNQQEYMYYDGSKTISITKNEDFKFLDEIPEEGVEVGTYSQSQGENICSLIIRVWIEGTDRECVSALDGGKFKVNVVFGSK